MELLAGRMVLPQMKVLLVKKSDVDPECVYTDAGQKIRKLISNHFLNIKSVPKPYRLATVCPRSSNPF